MADVRDIDDKIYIRTSTLVNSNNCEKVYEARNIQNPKDILYWHMIQKIGLEQEELSNVIHVGLHDYIIDSWNNETTRDVLTALTYHCITKEKTLIIDLNKINSKYENTLK